MEGDDTPKAGARMNWLPDVSRCGHDLPRLVGEQRCRSTRSLDMAPRVASRCHEAQSQTSEEECPANPAIDQWRVSPVASPPDHESPGQHIQGPIETTDHRPS